MSATTPAKMNQSVASTAISPSRLAPLAPLHHQVPSLHHQVASLPECPMINCRGILCRRGRRTSRHSKSLGTQRFLDAKVRVTVKTKARADRVSPGDTRVILGLRCIQFGPGEVASMADNSLQ